MDFAPADLTDGREPLDWRSRYTDPRARWGIRLEAAYLAILLLAVPTAIVILWLGYPQHWLRLSDAQYKPCLKYGLAWLGGVLGGTLHDLKWLYHVVAHQRWHCDRRLWRLFTPHISGGLAFAVMALISSSSLGIFDRQAESRPFVIGVSFMIGYFSDNALAKLTEMAERFLGPSRTNRKQDRDSPVESNVSTSDGVGVAPELTRALEDPPSPELLPESERSEGFLKSSIGVVPVPNAETSDPEE